MWRHSLAPLKWGELLKAFIWSFALFVTYTLVIGILVPSAKLCVFCLISETCRDVLCPGSSTCVVDQTNNAYCVTCNRICPEPTSPEQYLCGNDGITYASACHLRKATCLLGRSIGLAYEGKCVSKYLWSVGGASSITCFRISSVCMCNRTDVISAGEEERLQQLGLVFPAQRGEPGWT